MCQNYFSLNNKKNANNKKTTLVVILLFAMSSLTLSAKDALAFKAVSTSGTALYENSTLQLLSDGAFISSTSMSFSTYIYIPILHVKNKGDDIASNLLKELPIRYKPQKHFSSQICTAQNPIQNNTNLIQNT